MKANFPKFFLAGADEVGRGPLAGQVVGASALLFLEQESAEEDLSLVVKGLRQIGVTDSKKLTDKKRKEILNLLGVDIRQLSIERAIIISLNKKIKIITCLDEVSAECIDQINILNAAMQAMKNSFVRSWQTIGVNIPGILLIDGNRAFKLDSPEANLVSITPVVKGDAKSVLIGLASILAKVYRDEIFKALDLKYPGYDFAQNAGYPTAKHLGAIASLGVTPIHRKTFRGVKEYVDDDGTRP
ncbi:MAG: hypothetical protein A2504_16660 [Bdellovibrionales bacterium RIFOXYD12_FULL_39_22]|nr:MAG: hypothetical protein A2385_14515 [Bdellovibrionales bacterium RIFOXYB1_FULL_39_21]OFZ45041.1 MAG: hypothetical protein A2485_13940 [Bdellovibrionales bacterium RIFOXYC12_FULL_39_17]OFZ49479.1 MAG: hypothetical protein A2404_08425 [Bdellovibrionales bacterium RIFOXYC1_FULL_39_130]OFZ73283.1 MAG: hypothetical protein A2451_07620 [Bdellovibrionales bacterium RIFOXYC2_FULL_39_8]OFZ77218.1 MAG: hypothetical protein A2560_07950 [Bdellovibrionales bacterium RIFOXYD1_FULL_39_84]OFZ95663.1 MAG: